MHGDVLLVILSFEDHKAFKGISMKLVDEEVFIQVGMKNEKPMLSSFQILFGCDDCGRREHCPGPCLMSTQIAVGGAEVCKRTSKNHQVV